VPFGERLWWAHQLYVCKDIHFCAGS
jgi:hypothetical protein